MTTGILRAASLFACLFLAGCTGGELAAASYNANQDRMRYETGPFTVGQSSDNSYGSSKTVDLRVVARCQGENCMPDIAKLIFSASGGQKLSLSGVNGTIEADDEPVVTWNSSSAGVNLPGTVANNEVIRVLGAFAAVECDLDKVRQIATASSLDGSIGGIQLNLGSNLQAGLQAMLQKIDGGRQSPSSAR